MLKIFKLFPIFYLNIFKIMCAWKLPHLAYKCTLHYRRLWLNTLADNAYILLQFVQGITIVLLFITSSL